MTTRVFNKLCAVVFAVIVTGLLCLIVAELRVPSGKRAPPPPPMCEVGCLCGTAGSWCCCHGVCKPKCDCPMKEGCTCPVGLVVTDKPLISVGDIVSFSLQGQTIQGKVTDIKGDTAAVMTLNAKYAVKLADLTLEERGPIIRPRLPKEACTCPVGN